MSIINSMEQQPFFENLGFIARTVCKNATREALQYVQIKNNMLFSTNGVIACRVNAIMYPGRYDEGAYRVHTHDKRKITLIKPDTPPEFVLPEIDKVFPVIAGAPALTLVIPAREKVKDTRSCSRALYKLVRAGCPCLDFSVFTLFCGAEPRKFDVWIPLSDTGTVYFRSGALDAIICPINPGFT